MSKIYVIKDGHPYEVTEPDTIRTLRELCERADIGQCAVLKKPQARSCNNCVNYRQYCGGDSPCEIYSFDADAAILCEYYKEAGK